MELGKANYGTKKHSFKIADGDNVFRIFPAMGKLAKSGKWNQYYRVEWGYKNSEGRMRPFQDVRVVNFQTKMVEVESAAYLRREALKASKTALVEKLRENPKDASALQAVKEVNEDLLAYNCDAKYYLNVIDLNGKIGLLKLGSRAFKDLKLEIDKLRKKGVDPLAIEDGRFFNFNRSNATGNFQDTAYKVTVYQENVQINGKTYQEDKVHVIDEAIISRLDDEAFELSGMYPVVTAAQVQRIVDEGVTAVDEILGSGNSTPVAADDGEGYEESTTTTAATTTAATTAAATTTAKAVETKTTPTLVATEKITADPKKEVEKNPTVKTQSQDEFLRSIGALK